MDFKSYNSVDFTILWNFESMMNMCKCQKTSTSKMTFTRAHDTFGNYDISHGDNDICNLLYGQSSWMIVFTNFHYKEGHFISSSFFYIFSSLTSTIMDHKSFWHLHRWVAINLYSLNVFIVLTSKLIIARTKLPWFVDAV